METGQINLPKKTGAKRQLFAAVLITVLSQLGITYKGSQRTTEEVSANAAQEIAKVKQDFQNLRLEQEQHFVKKDELADFSRKIDSVHDDISLLNKNVAQIQGFLKAKNRIDFSQNP